MKKSAIAISLLFGLITACGGGGDPSEPEVPPVPVNSAPMISSGATASVPENSNDAFYTATATDADGDTLVFSISGGADAALFSIDASSGEVRFVSAPDFETPGDANTDNTYEIMVRASDPSSAFEEISVQISVVDDVSEAAGVRFRDEIFLATEVVDEGVLFATAINNSVAENLLMDIYAPVGDTSVDRPIIVVASGGGFIGQSRTNALVVATAESFARRGYVAAAIDYRVAGRFGLTSEELTLAGVQGIHDMFAAVRFLRADSVGSNEYGTRPDLVFVSGASAGGVMASSLATIDPDDEIMPESLADLLDSLGGVYGDIGNHPEQRSDVQGALSFSGAVLDLNTIDENSSVIYAAHDEFDPVVPCDTSGEGSSNTGLIVSGSCAMQPQFDAVGVPFVLLLNEDSMAHVGFSLEQFLESFDGAAELFYDNVIAPNL